MSSEQVEYSLALGFGIFLTLVGFGLLDMNLSDRRKSTLRTCGPLILVGFTILLGSTYLR